jgi:hypothetical protein
MNKYYTIILLFSSFVSLGQSDIKLVDISYSDCDNNFTKWDNNEIINKWFDGDTFRIEVSFQSYCDANFEGSMTFEDSTLYLGYNFFGDIADCWCCYQFIYSVIGLVDKDFDVNFLGYRIVTDYFRDPSISDNKGQTLNSDTSYFPNFKELRYFVLKNGKLFHWVEKDKLEEAEINYGKENIRDTTIFYNNRLPDFCSELLKKINEPILYNYYLNKKIIRFIWVKDSENAFVIRLEKNNDKIILVTKILNQTEDLSNYKEHYLKKVEPSDYKTLNKIILSSGIKSKFGSYPNSKQSGSEWILEMHDMSGYHYLNRWDCDNYNPIKQIGEYLIKLSGTKIEIYNQQ